MKDALNTKFSFRWLAGCLCLVLAVLATHASEREDWLNKMQPIIPKGYVCRRATSPIVIDGKLDDPAWAEAPWNEDSGDIEGPSKPKPRFRTHVKLLWDDNYLYIGAELEEPHVWATQTNHDSVIFMDPDFEVFIDPKGETEPYYEFEMNALNTTWDLLLDKPYMDGGKPHNDWEITGAKTAVQVRGTINNPSDTDSGWTVELAFPWSALSEHARHSGPPNDGEQWRIDFSRVEWQITTTNGYKKVPDTPEDNWVWSPQGGIDMHRPEMWGLLQFTTQPATQPVAMAPIPGKSARDQALEVYYAQCDYYPGHHEQWATNVAQLGISVAAGAQTPNIEPTPDGYTCAVSFDDGGKQRVWRIRQDRLLKLDQPMPVESDLFIKQAAEEFGEAGRRAAYFLLDNMPASDRSRLSCDYLMDDLSLAFKARQRFPWAKSVPERVFFNDVLPYASVDEDRELWRDRFYKMAGEMVSNCATATEAAQALNQQFFNRVKVHYNLKRKRNNQGPLDSIEQGKATCTGLSIILVDACRAVGVPARIAGVPRWVDKEGNHTWVEIWDGDWFFTGADEYTKEGLNRGWFTGDAAQTSRSDNPLNQVYATSWRRTGQYFPLAWDLGSREVNGVNVSARYAALASVTNPIGKLVHVRLFDKSNGERLAARAQMFSESGELLSTNYTRAGFADMNDTPDFILPPEANGVFFRFTVHGKSRENGVQCASCIASHTLDFAWNELTPVADPLMAAESWFEKPAADRGPAPDGALSRKDAARLAALAWDDLVKQRTARAADELAAKRTDLGPNQVLKWMERDFGDEPDHKHSLWITLHGGGTAPEEENDANWKGYYGRYEFPPGSINIAPRAPANSWNMWHVEQVDTLFDRLIADLVMNRGVDPDRVYLIGYSAGGDGVYHLAPRMADRFAAATMCAGHPNESTPEGLRNLPFFLYMGGEDKAYNRNVVVRQYNAKIDALQKDDPAGYEHRLTVYPGLSHNMQGREAESIPRMAALRRVVWPKRVVWKEDGFTHNRFYWLGRSADATNASVIYAAHEDGQTITIERPSSGSLTLCLSDNLVDLDKPIHVVAADRTVFDGTVQRSLASITQSLQEREDPEFIASARLPVSW